MKSAHGLPEHLSGVPSLPEHRRGVPIRRGEGVRETGGSACAERQPQFLLDRFVDLVEIERGFALIAQHFEYLRSSFFGHFHPGILQVDDMYLQRLD